MASFADQVQAFVTKTKTNVNRTWRESVLGLAAAIVDRSPVGMPSTWSSKPEPGYEPGTFKANWVGGEGYVNYTITDDKDTTGQVSLIAINSKLPEETDGTPFYITNSLPYAWSLENGHSGQAPLGIVNLTIQEWKGIVDAAAERAIVGASIL